MRVDEASSCCMDAGVRDRRFALMRVVLVFRSHRKGGYSIEELFSAIGAELAKSQEVITYQVGSRWKLFLDSWRLWRLNADVYHITGDVHYFAMFLPWRRVVLTVHDINHYQHDLIGIRKLIYKWLWLVLPLRTARVITVISEDTKRDLATHLNISADRINVVRDCFAPRFGFREKPFNERNPTILQIGTRPHKNVQRLVEALRGMTCKLVIVGEIDTTLSEKLIEYEINYENFTNLRNDQLLEKYHQADLVAFVSLAEGFGLPIIEANAVGRPVLTSNISPMSDVAADAACLVCPRDVVDIRNGIRKIITDAEYRDRLVSNGRRNAKHFRADAVANEYLDIYRRITANSFQPE